MQIKTAMLLAAGRGERLRPLTDTTPKPLLPVFGKPFIVHHLSRLQALGVEKVVINVSYLAKKIIDALGDGSQFNLHIEYSYEPTPLGPGGALSQALPLLGKDAFLLISSDIWTDFPYEKFFQKNWSLENNVIYCPVTDKGVHRGDFDLSNGKLALSSSPTYSYGYLAIMHTDAIKEEPLGFASLMPIFTKAITHGRASGEYYPKILNVNTLEEYAALTKNDLL